MLSSRKQWFTLVELIVIITILVILGTIAWINIEEGVKTKKCGNQTSKSTRVNDSFRYIINQGDEKFYITSYSQSGSCITGQKSNGSGEATVCGNYSLEEVK